MSGNAVGGSRSTIDCFQRGSADKHHWGLLRLILPVLLALDRDLLSALASHVSCVLLALIVKMNRIESQSSEPQIV